jgi:hypothetical protein
MLSIYRMDQDSGVSDLPTKNNARETSHWSGLGSSGVANNYLLLLLVETSDENEGITENPLSLSLTIIFQCYCHQCLRFRSEPLKLSSKRIGLPAGPHSLHLSTIYL